jgi:hypothetical protein
MDQVLDILGFGLTSGREAAELAAFEKQALLIDAEEMRR